MSEKNHKIVTAAANMFARYGYSKTTMGDIATEAGVARQTVYNAFPGKEEILRAVARQAGEDTFAAVMEIWSKAGSIEEKLTAFHEIGPIKWYEAIRAAPDWADLIDGLHKAASEEIAAQDIKWRAALSEVLQVPASKDAAHQSDNYDIVDFFYSTSMNAKHGAVNVGHLRSRLATIKAATLTLIKS